ncbi:MAG: WecB/TagA/CpsF family glycosyltransferase [Clostridiales bacterium]|jgi:N-acetylglucosaminyldiphosphoundecaprenol N-acetyl-beta-D-mannosaminyltransferase|nr:WecB/TagA/CpsF family glycosyltransferase [Clostridiales bacterium]
MNSEALRQEKGGFKMSGEISSANKPNNKTTEILGVNISSASFSENLEIAASFLDSGGFHMIFTPNPEFLVLAQKDRDFFNILNSGDLLVADGVGLYIASKLNQVKIKERTAGIDLIDAMFEKMKERRQSVYILGGKPGVAKKAAENIRAQYVGVTVCGFADGFFDEAKEGIIIEEIQTLKPDLLLVGIGFPRQEKWIFENRERLNVKAAIGCGGAIDVFAGNVKRAPALFRNLGLEWFHRLITQPSRFGRMLQLPVFLFMAVCERLRQE